MLNKIMLCIIICAISFCTSENTRISNDITKIIVDGDLLKLQNVLKKQKKQINAQDDAGWTMLHWATRHNQIEMVKYLLSNGADPYLKNWDKETPIEFSIIHPLYDVFNYFIDRKLIINKNDQHGLNSYIYAVQHLQYKKAELIINKGASIKLKDDLGNTYLHHTVIHEKKKLVKLLIEKGIDIKAKNDNGETALHLGLLAYHYFYRIDLIDILLKMGADINARDKKGRTPLMYYINRWPKHRLNVDTVEYLIKKGAIPHIEDIEGDSALDYAENKDINKVIAILKKAAANNKK